jgi:ammonia channel protein AmtB
MNKIKSQGKSILMGGIAAGIISLIPVINFLNVFFMMWMGVGGAISVYLLLKENKEIKTSDAVLTGALSGVTGGVIFGFFALFLMSRITPEKIEKMASFLKNLSTSLEAELNAFLQSSNFQFLLLMVVAILILFSIISGIIGGIIVKSVLSRKQIGIEQNGTE